MSKTRKILTEALTLSTSTDSFRAMLTVIQDLRTVYKAFRTDAMGIWDQAKTDPELKPVADKLQELLDGMIKLTNTADELEKLVPARGSPVNPQAKQNPSLRSSDLLVPKDAMDILWAYSDALPDKTIKWLQGMASTSKRAKGIEDFNIAQHQRNLDFHDKVWRDPSDLSFLPDIVPDYNNFNAEKVVKWLQKWKGIKVQVCRESSVCMYVKGDQDTLNKMEASADRDVLADEHGFGYPKRDSGLRLWWD